MSSSKGGWSVSDVTGSLLLDSEPALCIRSSGFSIGSWIGSSLWGISSLPGGLPCSFLAGVLSCPKKCRAMPYFNFA